MDSFDLIIKNGKIYNGMGNSWIFGDIGISGNRIAQTGKLSSYKSKRTIDASSLIVSPGFIDSHSHSDFSLLTNPKAESHLRQGVTTVVTGNCGISAFPVEPEKTKLWTDYNKSLMAGAGLSWNNIDDYYSKLMEQGLSVNIIPLIGHGNIRVAVMGMDNRDPSTEEIYRMKKILETHLNKGVFGMSTVLIKPPGCFSKTNELIELCKTIAVNNGIYSTHIRSESDRVEEAIQEAIDIGKAAAVSVQISHHKAAGKRNWGKTKTTLTMINNARKQGIDVMCDVYPYLAGSLPLVSLLPLWINEGGLKYLLEKIRNQEVRNKARIEMEMGLTEFSPVNEEGQWENVTIISVGSKKNSWVQGLTIPQIAKKRNMDIYNLIFDLLTEEQGIVRIVIKLMTDDDLDRILKNPFCAIGSDGWCEDSGRIDDKGLVHPRLYGTFAKVLGEYVRERSILSLEDAIRKMTSLPAQRYGLYDRGVVKSGMAADIVIFDAKRIADTATYVNPRSYPIGIEYVILNGKVVIDKKIRTDLFAGEILGRV